MVILPQRHAGRKFGYGFDKTGFGLLVPSCGKELLWTEQDQPAVPRRCLVELLDLVISVDTSVVHVAGALGKPTLLLLDAGHDWRWPTRGAESRWYPSVRIVRQPARGDWAGAIELAESEIERLV